MINSHLPIVRHVTAQMSSHFISIQSNAQGNWSDITAQRTEYQVVAHEIFQQIKVYMALSWTCPFILLSSPLFPPKPQLLVFEFPPLCSPDHLGSTFLHVSVCKNSLSIFKYHPKNIFLMFITLQFSPHLQPHSKC